MKFAIYYKKDPTFREANLTIQDILDPEQFVKVKEIEAEEIGGVFWRMQAEEWSPNGEARDLIRKLGLHHTSMSVGDVARDLESGIYYQCAMVGWMEVKKV
jgi:hypothetical protein